MHEIIGEIFFNNIAAIPQAYDEFVDAVGGVNFHDMPQDRLAANFHHRFGDAPGFFGQPGAQTAGKNDTFHVHTQCNCQQFKVGDATWPDREFQ